MQFLPLPLFQGDLLVYYISLVARDYFTCYKFLNKFKTYLYSRYLAPRPATMFRNRLCIDGGLTLFMPPTSAAQTVFLLFINLTIDYLLKPPFKCTGKFIYIYIYGESLDKKPNQLFWFSKFTLRILQ